MWLNDRHRRFARAWRMPVAGSSPAGRFCWQNWPARSRLGPRRQSVAGHGPATPAGRLVAMVPHWVPIAAVGMVLLMVGATYESRLQDLCRFRAALGRLR